ncbi:2-polyprenylphenol 6-hydroxylase [Desulfosporosinus sp. BICA1-9]|uniref:2-polyprenylphenol 6-hydroxylase n=1 Tax=Desulfosporosinus sp. BICA1-9 TaxID=1531958 RepID=UPI00054C1046|nr:2-polyprenylphenol 6-hydroxylase [Desulfosporosinus sp. BICA1-9]KJS46638.1 MAG: ABC transporter [Peptococcaceae bacterium BRH_c23]KJS89701.1 MAG: ABC transporter [Desulfosporosinus sp. BICA1-9]
MIGKRIRHIKRYRDVAKVLARHGFGYVVEEMGLLHMLSLPKRLFTDTEEIDRLSMGERIRRVIEELGPTYVKIGQIASTRADIIPEDILQELESLQDNVPSFSFEEVARIIEQELGSPIEVNFSSFDEKPIAAASIGQVHRAQLRTGERVAVKVQRPNIKALIETDLEILLDLATLAEHRMPKMERLQLRDVVEEFSKSLRNELDYTIEARNAEKIAKQFKKDSMVHIPSIYWDYSTRTVLTMEFVEGIKLNQFEMIEKQGFDRKAVAEQLVRSLFHQVLIEGFFHADPHPGNIFLLSDGAITLIDFGMVGRLTKDMKHNFASMVIAMMRQNTESMIQAVLRIGIVPDEVNLPLLTHEVDELREKYLDVPMSQISLGEAISDLFKVAFRHRIRIPSDFTLLAKCLLILEGIVEKLDPELSILDMAEPFGLQLLKERYRPSSIAGRVWHNVSDFGDLLVSLPKQMKVLMRDLLGGRIHLEVSVPELDSFLRKLDRISNRISFSIVLLSFSIVMAGLIIASALAPQPILLWQIPAIEIGFIVAGVMLLWLFVSIFRSGKF